MPARPDSHETLLRQWDMLRLIPRFPAKISAAVLTDRLREMGYALTKRTVERDLNALSASFPLVSDTRSMPFGWSWQRDAAPLDVPQLTPTQALAFVLMQRHLQALLPGSVTDDLAPYFKAAHQRLADVASGGAGRRWLERVRVVPPTQPLLPPKIDATVHAAVTEGLLRDRKLAITYRNRNSARARDAVVNPLALIQRGPLLYLAVTFEGYEDVRMLVLHRISRAEVSSDRPTRPAGFDLDQKIGEGRFDFGAGKSIGLVALFEEEATIHLAESPLSRDQVLEPVSDGWVKVSATVSDTPQLFWWLLGFGGRVEVLEPKNLRRRMVIAAEHMAVRYGVATGGRQAQRLL